MKNIILIVAFFIIQQGLYGQIVPRDILAAQGAPGNSYNWNPEINNMKADGYQIRPAFSIDYFSQSVTIAENVTKFDAGINLPIHNYTNVLGLGHDTGGLAIRGLKAQNDKITGQILVGTPNQGSDFLLGLHSDDGNGVTSIENFISNIEDWIGDIDCPSCNKTQNLKEYITGIKNQPYSYGAIYDPNSYYNTLPDVDHNSTAVIWGDAGNQTLGDFLGSRGGVQSTSNVDLQECFDRLIAEKTAEIDRDEEILLIEKTSSFFSNVLNFISQVYDSKGDVSKILKASSTYINDYSEDLVKEIRAQDNIDKEIQDLLICNLANQRLEAQWIIEVQGESSEFTSTLVESPDFDEELCEFWTYQCQYASYHPDHNTFCENQNMYCGEYIYQLQFEENDFVYTRSEQTIPNLARTYRIEANHLQEQQWDRNKVPLEELYSGDLGPVFRVPKI